MSTARSAVELPPMGNMSPELIAQKSLTHWVWTPYKDINNRGPIDLKSQIGYRDQRWEVLRRCVPYPLGNLTSYSADRATAAELHTTGLTIDSSKLPPIVHTKYAQEQANELGETYRDQGFRVLLPFLGIDDADLVEEIIQVVQPFYFAIHEMLQEFAKGGGAEKRIAKSALNDDNKAKAYQLTSIMLSGARAAELEALREYEELIKSMSDASVGKPGISNPTKFHEWICEMLNKEVPARINRTQTAGNGTDSATINALLDRDAKREQELAKLREQTELLLAQQTPQTEKRVNK